MKFRVPSAFRRVGAEDFSLIAIDIRSLLLGLDQ
jgi:hypothetical protein